MRGAPLIRSVLAACNEGGLIGSSNMTQTPLWSSRTNAVDIGEPSSTVNEKMQQSENVAQQRYKRRFDSPRCSTKEIPLSHDCSRRSRGEVDTSAFPKMKSPAGFLQSKDFAFDRQPPLSKWKRGRRGTTKKISAEDWLEPPDAADACSTKSCQEAHNAPLISAQCHEMPLCLTVFLIGCASAPGIM